MKIRTITLFELLVGLAIITACSRQSNEDMLVGKWKFQEFIIGSADSNNPEFREGIRKLTEETKNMHEAWIMSFEADKSFNVYDGNQLIYSNSYTQYRLKDTNDRESENGKIIEFSPESILGHNPTEIIHLDKNTLKIKRLAPKIVNQYDGVEVYEVFQRVANGESKKRKAIRKKGSLNDELARITVEKLLSRGDDLPDNRTNARLVQWQGLFEISENEMHAKAVIKQKHEMTGKFIFRKNVENEWVLVRVEFRSQRSMNSWYQDVFQKVE